MSETQTIPTVPPPAPDAASDSDERRGSAWRVAGWTLLGVLGLLAVVVVAGLVYISTDAGKARVQTLAVAQIQKLLADDAEVSVDGLSGNFLTGAKMTGLVVRRQGDVVLTVDTVLVDYTLTTLLRRTFSASHLAVSGATLVARQREDGSFNVAGLLKPADPERDTSKAGIAVLLDSLAIRRSRAEVHWWPPGGTGGRGDSVLVVDSLDALVTNFVSRKDSLVGTIDGLSLVAVAPYDASRLRVASAGRFSRERLVLQGLDLRGAEGTRAGGRALLAFQAGALPVFEAALEATPLALADARAFAPVPLYGDPRLKLTANSDGTLLTFSLLGSLGEAALSLDGELTRQTDAPLRYQAEGALRRLDLAALTRNPALAGEVTGDLRVDLQGTEPRALSGPFRVSLRESRFGGRRIDRLALDGAFAAGRVTFDLDGRIPGLDLTAKGEARPFDLIPSVQLNGRARDLDLAVLLPGQGTSGRVAGDFALIGRGKSVETFTGTAAITLDRADLRLASGQRLALARASVDADLDGGAIAFDADAALAGGGGRLLASGAVDTAGEVLRYTVDDGRLEGLNLAALTGNPAQESRLTGTFTLDGTGADPASLTLDATAALRGSRFGRFDIQRADVDARLRGGVLTLDADTDLGAAGGIAATGTVRPFVDPLTYDLSGRLRNVDVSELTGNPDQTSDLTGAFTARGSGIDPATMTLDATVQLAPSRYAQYDVDGSDLDVSLRSGALAISGTLDTPDGAFALNVRGRPFDANPSFDLADGTCFSNLDVGRLANKPDLDTRLSGCFAGRIAGLADLATANADGVLTLRRSTINDAEIEGGRIAFTLAQGALGATMDVELAALPTEDGAEPAAGRVVAAVQARPFDAVPTYALRGRTDRLDLGQLLGFAPDQPARFTLDFDVSGEGTDPSTMTLDGRFTAGGASRVGPVRVDTLTTRFALGAGVLRVDTLALNTDLADLTGGGTIALFNPDAASDFRLVGDIESLAPLNAYTEQTLGLERGAFDLTAQAQPGEPLRIAGTLDAQQLIIGDNAVTGIDGRLDATVDRAGLDSLGLAAVQGSLTSEFNSFARPGLAVQKGRLTVGLDGEDVTVRGSVVVDERRDFELAARFDPDTNPLAVTIESGRLGLDGVTWRLVQPSRVALQDGIDIRGLLLTSEDGGGQQIAADGRLDFTGEQDLVVTMENVRVDALAAFAGFDALGGQLSATLALSGPAAAPVLDGTVQFDDLTSQGEPVGAVAAQVGYADGRLGLDAVLTHVDGQTLTVDGYVPRRFSLAKDGLQADSVAADDEVRLVARATAFPIDWVRPFLNDRAYSDIGGTLRLDLTVTGTQADPLLDGIAMVTDGRIGVVATGLVYPFAADVTFRGNRVALDDVRVVDAETGETRLDVDGQITLRELSLGELDLTITPRSFTAMDTRTYDRLVLDAGATPLRLTGTLTKPVLRGAVVLAKGDIYVTDELVPPDIEQVELTAAQIRELEARFGRTITRADTAVSRFTDALDYNLTVQIRQNVWIRADAGLAYDIEFEGDVQAIKPAFAEESQLYGSIDLIRGTVETLNRRFDIERGVLVFNGPALGARVDLLANLDVKLAGSVAGQSSATITLTVMGNLDDNPRIVFSSNPAMEPADILSVIATGQLADNFASASAVGGVLTGAVAGQLGGLLEGLASRNLGLDLAQIDVGENGTLVIRVGKYLTNRLFLTGGFVVNQASAASSREGEVPIEITLDYQLMRWLQAQTEYSGQRGVGGGLEAEVTW